MSGILGALLLAAERRPWAPADWSLVPAWRLWRADVAAGRRPVDQDDALAEAAYWEAEACLAAAHGSPDSAAWSLARADECVRESPLEKAA